MRSTRNDFWQTIWSNRTTIIVAVYTDENLSSDVFNYWPLPHEMIDCGNIHVDFVDEHFECDYIYRDCLIRSTKVWRREFFSDRCSRIVQEKDELRVTIISSSYWPDACSPIETSFHLINTIQDLHPHTPIVVHDHTGGYRSGKFSRTFASIAVFSSSHLLCSVYHQETTRKWRNSRCLRISEILLPQTTGHMAQ